MALKYLLFCASIVVSIWYPAALWGIGESADCADIRVSSSDRPEISKLAGHCARGDIEKLNAALNARSADVEVNCRMARREFREGEAVRATVALHNRSDHQLQFLNLLEERLTGRSYLHGNELRDDYLLRPKLPANRVAVVQPGALFKIPMVLEVEGIGSHRVSITLVRPEWKSVGSGGSEITNKVVAETQCTFEVAR